MLVIDPAKRYTIEQIKNHKWMQMEGGEPSPVTSPVVDIPKPIGEFNEQALRLMQSLGIDQQKTIEVNTSSDLHMECVIGTSRLRAVEIVWQILVLAAFWFDLIWLDLLLPNSLSVTNQKYRCYARQGLVVNSERR